MRSWMQPLSYLSAFAWPQGNPADNLLTKYKLGHSNRTQDQSAKEAIVGDLKIWKLVLLF